MTVDESVKSKSKLLPINSSKILDSNKILEANANNKLKTDDHDNWNYCDQTASNQTIFDSGLATAKIDTLKMESTVQLSFQLMTCAEPPEMVIASIKSLLAIKAPADEILIIDNNNTASELYEPLAKFCNSLDDKLKVRFHHIDSVAGFKSGALNLALELMDSDSTHIVVVDSDYQALPHAHAAIIAAIQRYPNHALLQFPQFYRDADRVEVHGELNHYFNYHLYRPFNRQRALSTGTYAVIQHAALMQLGGWSGASITEDAQMGVLMHKQGLRSQFVPEVIATGLLPTTISDLMNQRRRWIYGNAQVLKGYAAIPSGQHSKLSSLTRTDDQENNANQRLAYKRAHLSQLSAWMNATGIFILLQAITVLFVLGALITKANVDYSLLLTPLYLVYASYGFYLARRLWAYWHDSAPLNKLANSAPVNNSISQRLKVWALHLNFWELGALSWLPVLWGRDKPFICTPKRAIERSQRTLWLENILALPKLLLVLNVITAAIVAPFSPLYTPVLFICALTICLLKLWAAKVVLVNYAYKKSSVKPRAKISIKPSIAIESLAAIKRLPINDEQANDEYEHTVVVQQQMGKSLFIKQPLTIAKLNNKINS